MNDSAQHERFARGTPREGNEERRKAELRKVWRGVFPQLDAAREELAAAEAGETAAEAELREAEAAVEDHEYSRLLAAREAASQRAKEAKARRRRASDSIQRVSEAVPSSPYGYDGRESFDREHAEWRREQESAGQAPAAEEAT